MTTLEVPWPFAVASKLLFPKPHPYYDPIGYVRNELGGSSYSA